MSKKQDLFSFVTAKSFNYIYIYIYIVIIGFMSISTGKENAQTTEDDQTMGQQPSVDQLDDVKSTDWAYEALKNLDERYHCLTSSPGKSNLFEGDRAITRYEFADGLNLCLEQMDKLIGNVSKDFIKKEDLEKLGRLKSDFSPEITKINDRLDKLDAKKEDGKPKDGRVTILEKNQVNFSPNLSTKVKLNGEVILGLDTLIGDKKAVSGTQNPTEKLNDNTTFSNRVRLNFDVSDLFNPDDRTRVRLQSANTIQFNRIITGTAMSRLGFDSNTDNNFEVHRLEYNSNTNPAKKIGKLNFILAINGVGLDDMLKTNNSFYRSKDKKNEQEQITKEGQVSESASTGPVSAFGRFAPIFRQSDGGAGLAVQYDFSNNLSVSGGFLAKQANDPTQGKGLFNGNHSIFIQLDFWKWKKNPDTNEYKDKPERLANDFTLAVTYVNSYENPIMNATDKTLSGTLSGNTGSLFANLPFNDINDKIPIPTSSHHFGLEGSYKISKKSLLDFWLGYTLAEAEITSGLVTKGNQAQMLNWGVRLGFGDQRKDILGIVIGMPPKVISNDIKDRVDHDTSLHIEGFYRYRLNKNDENDPNKKSEFYITPGFIWNLNPEHNGNNDSIFIGIIRGTFLF